MALIWTLVRFLFCLFVVEALPKFPRDSDFGYVIATLPQQCVSPPSHDKVCNLKHDIAGYRMKVYGALIVTVNNTKNMIKSLFGKYPGCADAVASLNCQLNFPACLDGGRVDYGDKKQLFSDVNNACPLMFGKILLSKSPFKEMKSGVHRDPYAYVCVDVPQDPQGLCPKPKYKLPKGYVKDYFAQMNSVVAGMAEHKDGMPSECYEKAKNIFACTYAFCSSDEHFLLLKTTRKQCFSVLKCFKKYGKLDDEIKKVFNETCPKYPDKKTYKKVALPVVIV